MNKTIINFIKVILTGLLFLCLIDMPYGFYQFVRFASFIGFTFLAYHSKQKGKVVDIIIYLVLALLFQPFSKIALGKQIWNIIDVIVGIGLLISMCAQSAKR